MKTKIVRKSMGQDHVSLPKKVEVRKYYYFQFLELVYKFQCTKIFPHMFDQLALKIKKKLKTS